MADISPGLDIPTRVFSSAEEAIQLNQYPAEVRPYIEDIFIMKYPKVVSLHSLDAGNLSLTLGYVMLRLRKGETLPRSRRIYHISPVETRHLEDILDLLTKHGFVCPSPVDPNGTHLYGLSSYLVPRAKPGVMGRLIVDFSVINDLLESPPNVVPETGATLQFLKNKMFFSSIDLRYAYLALRLSPESRALTTFLTPTGSYPWISLPTGAASSPSYFLDAIYKILHFEPVTDGRGDPVYEAPNLVKLEKDPL
jgi:hypothetical protein